MNIRTPPSLRDTSSINRGGIREKNSPSVYRGSTPKGGREFSLIYLLNCNFEAFAINRYHYDTSRSSDSFIVRVQYFVSNHLT